MKTIFLFFTFLLVLTHQKNILFYYSFPGQSHFTFAVELSKLLSTSHNVTFVAPIELKSYIDPPKEFTFIESNPKIVSEFKKEENSPDLTALVSAFSEVYPYDHEQLTNLFEKTKFDLVLGDETISALLDVPKAKGIQTVITSSLPMPIAGFHETNYLPDLFCSIPLKELNYFQRIKKFYYKWMWIVHGYKIYKNLGMVRRKFGYKADLNFRYEFQQLPTISSSFFPFAYPTNIHPMVFFTGGNIKERELTLEPIVSDWLNEMKKRELKVIYIAFGSMIQIDKVRLEKLLHGILAVGSTSVLLGLRKDNQESINFNLKDYQSYGDKILVKEWVNQYGILAHDAVKIFFSHCGYQSVLESLNFGKPIISIGNGRDQTLNSIRIDELELGIRLNMENFTTGEVTQKTHKVLDNYEFYNTNMKKMNAIRVSNGGVNKGKEIVEYVLEFGSKHLTPVTQDMGVLTTTSMDVYITFISIPLGFLFVIYKLFCCILCGKTKLKKD
jgi:UDP:flavonoid glycosyltransferase YjiC (YdhE family)